MNTHSIELLNIVVIIIYRLLLNNFVIRIRLPILDKELLLRITLFMSPLY